MIYICGAGPTGLTLASIFQRNSRDVVVFEKTGKVGGTWTPTYTNGYFTHHTPQVVSTAYLNTRKLFSTLGLDFWTYFKRKTVGWSQLLYSQSNIQDKLYLISGFMYYIIKPEKSKKITLKHYFKNKLSTKCINVLNRITYLLDGIGSDKMTLWELYASFDQTALYSTMQVNSFRFLSDWASKLKPKSVQFDVSVRSIHVEVDNSLTIVTEKGMVYLKSTDVLIFALDPLSLYRILEKSDSTIQNNWGDWISVKEKILTNSYVSISVQLHFKELLADLSPESEIGLNTEWKIISLFVRTENMPRNKNMIQSILSCSLININLYSSRLKKIISDCTLTEIQNEVCFQLLKANPNLPKPFYITNGTTFSEQNPGYEFYISSKAVSMKGPLCSLGHIPNLWIAGPVTPRSFAPTTMEVAVSSGMVVANRILGLSHKLKHPFRLVSFVGLVSLIIIIVIICLILISMRRNLRL